MEALAQYFMALYLEHRYILRNCTPTPCFQWPYNAEQAQTAFAWSGLVSVLVLLVALLLIKKQTVLRKNPNTYMMLGVSLMLLIDILSIVIV